MAGGAQKGSKDDIDKLVQDARERKWIQRLEARATLQPFVSAPSSPDGGAASERNGPTAVRTNRSARGGSLRAGTCTSLWDVRRGGRSLL